MSKELGRNDRNKIICVDIFCFVTVNLEKKKQSFNILSLKNKTLKSFKRKSPLSKFQRKLKIVTLISCIFKNTEPEQRSTKNENFLYPSIFF